MAEQQPVANSAWKGRTADGGSIKAVTDDDVTNVEPVTQPRSVSVRDLASILCIVVGVAAGMGGAAVLWGPGGLLLTLGVALYTVGLMLGAGE